MPKFQKNLRQAQNGPACHVAHLDLPVCTAMTTTASVTPPLRLYKATHKRDGGNHAHVSPRVSLSCALQTQSPTLAIDISVALDCDSAQSQTSGNAQWGQSACTAASTTANVCLMTLA